MISASSDGVIQYVVKLRNLNQHSQGDAKNILIKPGSKV